MHEDKEMFSFIFLMRTEAGSSVMLKEVFFVSFGDRISASDFVAYSDIGRSLYTSSVAPRGEDIKYERYFPVSMGGAEGKGVQSVTLVLPSSPESADWVEKFCEGFCEWLERESGFVPTDILAGRGEPIDLMTLPVLLSEFEAVSRSLTERKKLLLGRVPCEDGIRTTL